MRWRSYFEFPITFLRPYALSIINTPSKQMDLHGDLLQLFCFVALSHWAKWTAKRAYPARLLTFWHRSFTFNSNKSQTWSNSFSVYYPDVCLQLNMFRAFSRPLSGAQWLQWQPLVLPSYRGDSRTVFVVGPAGPTTNTARLSLRYEGKTRGCHCRLLSSW